MYRSTVSSYDVRVVVNKIIMHFCRLFFASSDGGVSRTDWPLDRVCVRLLADLWNFRWETRHGAASGLRELLFDNQHTRQAGKRNGANEAEVCVCVCV